MLRARVLTAVGEVGDGLGEFVSGGRGGPPRWSGRRGGSSRVVSSPFGRVWLRSRNDHGHADGQYRRAAVQDSWRVDAQVHRPSQRATAVEGEGERVAEHGAGARRAA
jgi:hypothetical protein